MTAKIEIATEINSTFLARKLYSTINSEWTKEAFMAAHMTMFVCKNKRMPKTEDYNEIQWNLIKSEILGGLIDPETAEIL